MRKNGKAILAMVGAAILAAGALAGCAAASGQSAEATQAAQSAGQTQAGEAAGTSAPAAGQAAGTSAPVAGQATGQTSGEAAASGKTAEADLSGSIRMVGSTSMEKFANALSEALMEKYPDVTVSPQFVGSGAGVEAVLNGTADIGNASRNLKDEEKEMMRL